MLRIAAIAAAASLAACAAAGAATPAQGLAKQLKTQMVSTYRLRVPGLRFTTVSCIIATDQTRARCIANFTLASRRRVGYFTVLVGSRVSGQVEWQAVSSSCTNSKTGKKLACF